MVLQDSIVAYVLFSYSTHDNLEERRVLALGDQLSGGRWEGAGVEWRHCGREDG